jgi:AraC-like DNA-binding protein
VARFSPVDEPGLKSADGLGAWNDIVDEAFVGTVVDASEQHFDAELWRCQINDLKLIRVRAQPSQVRRWLHSRPARPSGSVLLHLQSVGTSLNLQRGRTTAIDAGDAALCDPDHGYVVDFPTPYEMFIVDLPLAGIVLREPGFDLERASCQKVDSRRSQLLLAFLRAAWQQRDCLSEDEDWRDCVSRTSRDLALRAITQAGGMDVIGASAELRRDVFDYIRRNIADPALRTSSIAQALNVSARTVQSVFERLATTTSGFILQTRLERAAERLIDRPGGQTITELAYDCGFSDSAYFSRCFSGHYGVSPRDYRRSGGAGAKGKPAPRG